MIKSDVKVKGVAILSLKEFFNKEFGPSYFSRKIHNYYPDLQSQVLASTWYPMEPFVNWIYDSSVESKTSYSEYVVKMTTFILENDLNGVYNFFLKLGGTKRVLNMTPQFVKAYINCVEIKIIENINGYEKFEYTVPQFMSEWQKYGQEGAHIGIVKSCGNIVTEFKMIKQLNYFKDNLEFSRMTFELHYK